jgi:hypothetical protein
MRRLDSDYPWCSLCFWNEDNLYSGFAGDGGILDPIITGFSFFVANSACVPIVREAVEVTWEGVLGSVVPAADAISFVRKITISSDARAMATNKTIRIKVSKDSRP